MPEGGVLFNGVPMIMDATHHPNSAIGKPMRKQEGQSLDPACCCRCCCNFDDCGGTVPTPATLTATLITTGDCSCLPASVSLPQVGATCSWDSGTTVQCGETFKIVLSCEFGTPPNCPWSVSFVCDLPQAIEEIEEISCDPLYIKFTPFTPLSVACCTGTVQIIITE